MFEIQSLKLFRFLQHAQVLHISSGLIMLSDALPSTPAPTQ